VSEYKLKILLLGPAASGKQQLMQRFVRSRFSTDYKLTVGVDILTKEIEYTPGRTATLSIWDIGGQERFSFIRTTFYRGASGAMLVFDLSRAATWDQIQRYYEEMCQFAGNIPFVLVGNNVELLAEVGEQIDREECRRFAEDYGGIYIETSSRTGQYVEEAFIQLTNMIITRNIEQQYLSMPGRSSDTARSILETENTSILLPAKDLKILFCAIDVLALKTVLTKVVEIIPNTDLEISTNVDFFVKEWHKADTAKVKMPVNLVCWTMISKIRQQPAHSSVYLGGNGVVIIFDVYRPASWMGMIRWYEEIMEMVGPIPALAIGVEGIHNANSPRISIDMCRKYAAEHRMALIDVNRMEDLERTRIMDQFVRDMLATM
jgi:Ras-related protein Rab-11A